MQITKLFSVYYEQTKFVTNRFPFINLLSKKRLTTMPV